MTPEDRFQQLVAVARDHGSARRWEACGRAWIEAGRVAVDAGALPQARASLDAAGEVFRRDDRLADAEKALRMVLNLRPTPKEAALARVRLAAVLGEQGRTAEALALVGDPSPDEPGLAAMVLDTRIGLLWSRGFKEPVRALVAELTRVEGEDGIAALFRTGQLHRMDGEFDQACRCYRAVIERLTGQEGAETGIAAARTEIGEVDLLRGRPEVAIEAWREGRALHEAAGRTSMALRAEAGRVRALVEAGLDALPAGLEEGLRYARDRGLVMLTLELQIALGTALASSDPNQSQSILLVAIAAADQRGARLHAGRARLQLATRVPLPEDQRQDLLRRAAEDLADHLPLLARAVAAARGSQAVWH